MNNCMLKPLIIALIIAIIIAITPNYTTVPNVCFTMFMRHAMTLLLLFKNLLGLQWSYIGHYCQDNGLHNTIVISLHPKCIFWSPFCDLNFTCCSSLALVFVLVFEPIVKPICLRSISKRHKCPHLWVIQEDKLFLPGFINIISCFSSGQFKVQQYINHFTRSSYRWQKFRVLGI